MYDSSGSAVWKNPGLLHNHEIQSMQSLYFYIGLVLGSPQPA